jgi:uncharacterized HAD superfamily protein
MNIAFDLDGVLYDWHKAVELYLRTTKKDWNVSHRDLWERPHEFLTEGEWDYIASLSPLYYTEFPNPKVLDYVKYLDSEGATIYYVTNRIPDLEYVTKKYLQDYGFPQSGNLVFTKDKGQVARIHEIDVFVEDKPSNLEALSGLCRVIGIKQIWNEEKREYLESLGVLFLPSAECLKDVL